MARVNLNLMLDNLILNRTIHRQALRALWRTYSPIGFKCRRSTKGKEETLEALIEYGKIVIVHRGGYRLLIARAHWDLVKGLPWFGRSKVCFACGGRSQCKHHIIWIKNGGRHVRRNIVHLCDACHAEVHPWLKKKRSYSPKSYYRYSPYSVREPRLPS